MQEIKIEENLDERMDAYLSKFLDISRSKVAKRIDSGTVLVNDKKEKSSYIPKMGDVITIEEIEDKEMSAEPEKMDLNIVYEDNDVIVINKDNGIVVHPAVGNNTGTLVNGLLYHSNLSSVNGKFRPGIVHRIDSYTTGLLVVAKNDTAHEKLANQLETREISRIYYTLVWGIVKHDSGTIDAPIGRDTKDRKKMSVTSYNSKGAVTHFKVIERFDEVTLLECRLETGRTHQIRVHLEYINHPIVNDPVYGRRKIIDDTGQCLHAKRLGFVHPTSDKYMEFDSELPQCFTNIMNEFINE